MSVQFSWNLQGGELFSFGKIGSTERCPEVKKKLLKQQKEKEAEEESVEDGSLEDWAKMSSIADMPHTVFPCEIRAIMSQKRNGEKNVDYALYNVSFGHCGNNLNKS